MQCVQPRLRATTKTYNNRPLLQLAETGPAWIVSAFAKGSSRGQWRSDAVGTMAVGAEIFVDGFSGSEILVIERLKNPGMINRVWRLLGVTVGGKHNGEKERDG